MQAVRFRLARASLLLTLAACGGKGEGASPQTPPPSITRQPVASVGASAAVLPAERTPRPDAAAIYRKLSDAFRACYESGRETTPTMLDGKVTLNASFDVTGKATCAIPSEATGLTQQVADCMSDRLAAETFGPGAAWTEVVPLVIHGGVLGLGEHDAKTMTLESVETHHMPDAFDVLESLVPRLSGCLQGLDRASGIRSIMVLANVGSDGTPRCVIASPSSGALPARVSSCAVDTFTAARFPPPTPKGSPGVILVPLNLVGR